MSITSQSYLANSSSLPSVYFANNHAGSLKTRKFSPNFSSKHSANLPHLRILRTKAPNRSDFKPFNIHRWPLRAFDLDGTVREADSSVVDDLNLDVLFSIVEFLCLASSAVISIGCAVNSAILSSQKPVIAWLGNKVFVWQFVLLVGAVVIGASFRRRQWRRICLDVSKAQRPGINLIERIEKLESDLRSSETILRVLSRKLEKLGIRFRVTRKAMKVPIVETAALAQKNSEVAQALAAREDILENELSEIQQVLLAMQEQQQKQLELILAIGKTGKLWDSERVSSQDQEAIKTCNSAEGAKKMATLQIQALAGQESNNDTA